LFASTWSSSDLVRCTPVDKSSQSKQLSRWGTAVTNLYLSKYGVWTGCGQRQSTPRRQQVARDGTAESLIPLSFPKPSRLRQQQHRVPYEHGICTLCNWHCVHDEEHVLLDCPSADLANLRAKHRQLFRSPSSSSNRLRDFVSQADTKGLALYVHECLECCA